MPIRVPLGWDAHEWKQRRQVPVVWDLEKLANGHTLLLGMSGAGKTHLLKKIISSISSQCAPSDGVRVHVFDPHGDINIAGASEILFSEQTRVGLQPFRVNPDPDFGGVRRQIQQFIATVNKASKTPLGVKQEAVIRSLLSDVYRAHGFNPEIPSTWLIDESAAHMVHDGSDGRIYLDVPYEDRDKIKAFGGRWDAERKLWYVMATNYFGEVTRWRPKMAGRTFPTLTDVLDFARRQLKIAFMGSDQEAITALEAFHKVARTHHKKRIESLRDGRDANDEHANSLRDASKDKALAAFTRYLDSVQTGVEFDNLLKYDSVDVLKSVVDRFDGLKATGLFKNAPEIHDPYATVWTYKLNPLVREEKKMFVLFKLQELFNKSVQRGEQDRIRDVFVVDEIATFVDDDDSNILNIISREARKFGVALIGANQSPVGLPDGFMSSIGTKIILKIDEMYWKLATSKMMMDAAMLTWIRPRTSACVQFKEIGAPKADWRYVVFGNGTAPGQANHKAEAPPSLRGPTD